MNRPDARNKPSPQTAMELAFQKAAQDLADKRTARLPAQWPHPTPNTLHLKPKKEPRHGNP